MGDAATSLFRPDRSFGVSDEVSRATGAAPLAGRIHGSRSQRSALQGMVDRALRPDHRRKEPAGGKCSSGFRPPQAHRELAGVEPASSERNRPSSAPEPPAGMGLSSTEVDAWLTELDSDPLEIQSGRVNGRLYKGENLPPSPSAPRSSSSNRNPPSRSPVRT